MFSKTNRSRSTPTKRKRHHHPKRLPENNNPSSVDEQSTIVTLGNNNSVGLHKTTRVTRANQSISQLITLLARRPLALAYYISMSMSGMFYHVMGAGIRCPKIKKHPGIKLRPINKAKEPFVPNDMLLYSCESEDFKQTIKCLDDGRWSEIPHCLDPSNNTCPELDPVPHGTYNASGSGPFKVGSVLAFRCENEVLPPSMMAPFINQQQLTTTTQSLATATTLSTTTTSKADVIFQNASQGLAATAAGFQPLNENYANTSETVQPLRYNLTGHRVLKCMPSSKWNYPVPTCTPLYQEPPSNLPFLLTTVALILIPLLILITISRLVMKWRKRKQQQERWKQYFTDYKYRHSKTNITFGQRPEQPQAPTTIPVTDL